MSLMRTINERAVVVLAPQVSLVEDPGGIVAFDSRRGSYWRGNRAAGSVLTALKEQRTVAEVAAMVDTSGESRDRVVADVSSLVSELSRAGLIKVISR